MTTGRPDDDEFGAHAKADIDAVAGDDAIEALRRGAEEVAALFEPLGGARVAGRTYAPGKWTLKQVLGHMIDDERIFAYRALCIARGDRRELPGFDENEYMAGSDFETRPLASLLEEYRTVRAATISLFAPLPPEAWRRRGVVNGYEASVRGLAWHIAGHELHHLRVLRERYL
jgi:hypothetical protein